MALDWNELESIRLISNTHNTQNLTAGTVNPGRHAAVNVLATRKE